MTIVSSSSQCSSDHPLTYHATIRMQQRGIRHDAVQAAIAYGRRIHAKGLTFCVLGRKEVLREAERGRDLRDFEGLHVLMSHDGAVVTAYCNRDLHAIKATRREHRNAAGRH